jgi:hypothetical protein
MPSPTKMSLVRWLPPKTVLLDAVIVICVGWSIALYTLDPPDWLRLTFAVFGVPLFLWWCVIRPFLAWRLSRRGGGPA